MHSEIARKAASSVVTITRPENDSGSLIGESPDKESSLEGSELYEGENSDDEERAKSNKVMTITRCPHADRKHYAKVSSLF